MVLTHFIDFFVTFYSFWRPNCKYITRDGFVLSYSFLNLMENSTELVDRSNLNGSLKQTILKEG